MSRHQLERLGVGKAVVSAWARDGYLIPVHGGVYAVGHRPRTIEGRLAAALLYAGEGAMLSHATALWWLGLLAARPATIHVSTPRRRSSLSGVRVYGRRQLERAWHKGFPVTEVAVALRDYATGATPAQLRRALAEAEYHRMLDARAIDDSLGRGRPGACKLRDAMERHLPRLALTRSELEERFLALCETAGLPLPEVNPTVQGMTVDALWREERLIVELDGHQGHATPARIERDRRRELRLRAAGFTVLRYTWRQLIEQPQLVVADLTAALARAA